MHSRKEIQRLNKLAKEILDLVEDPDFGTLNKAIQVENNARLIVEDAEQSFDPNALPNGISKSGYLCRSTKLKYCKQPLSTDGNRFSDGRFHRKAWTGMDCLYLAENEKVADLEIKNSRYIPVPPHLKFWIKYDLKNILDLRDEELFTKCFALSNQTLLLPTHYFNDVLGIDAFSQMVGKFLYKAGYEGLIYSSVKNQKYKNLCIFPENLGPQSSLSVLHQEDFQAIGADKSALSLNIIY